MNLLVLSKTLELLKPVFNFLKYAAGFLYIRRSTKIEVERDVLEQANAVQKTQLDIAANTDPDPSDVRDSMRAEEL